MDILFIAIPIALLVAAVFVAAFLWSVRTGQWDDLDTPAIRMLFEEEKGKAPKLPSAHPATGPVGAEERQAPSAAPSTPETKSEEARNAK